MESNINSISTRTKAIIESNFFLIFIREYVEIYFTYGKVEEERLRYALCNSDEERDIATLAEIKKIKKKIRKKGYECLSTDFLLRYDPNYPVDYSKEVNKPFYWENMFHQYFIRDIEGAFLPFRGEVEGGLMPFTEAQLKLDKLPDSYSTEDIDEETLKACFLIIEEKRDVSFLIKCENEIIDQIETDIEFCKENDRWEIDSDFYQGYIDQSDAIRLLFRLCELLVLLLSLKAYEFDLKYDRERRVTLENELKPGPSKITKSTIDFLIGTPSEKLSLLKFLVDIYSGKKGKNIAIMILALEVNKLIAYTEKSELYSALKVDFGNIGSDAGINKYLTEIMCMDKEYRKKITLHAEKIKKYMENIPI